MLCALHSIMMANSCGYSAPYMSAMRESHDSNSLYYIPVFAPHCEKNPLIIRPKTIKKVDLKVSVAVPVGYTMRVYARELSSLVCLNPAVEGTGEYEKLTVDLWNPSRIIYTQKMMTDVVRLVFFKDGQLVSRSENNFRYITCIEPSTPINSLLARELRYGVALGQMMY